MKKLLHANISKIYMIVIILISVLFLVGYYSYAMFTVSKEKQNALSIVTGGLNYTITGTNVTNNQITVDASSIVDYTITVTSLNEISSKYQLYYLDNSDVVVYYDSSNEEPSGTIGATSSTSATKTITITVQNTSSSSQTITLGVQGGLTGATLTLESGRTAVSENNTHTITTRSVTGGSVTVAVSSAKVGETVSFTTSPSSYFGYMGATIRDSSQNILSTLDSSTTSFTMPGVDTVVSPKWRYSDKTIMLIDSSQDTTWTSSLTDGSVMDYNFITDRHYFGFTISTNANARRVAWTSKAYDLTHYATLQVNSYEYTVNSSYSADNYHATMYVGVATSTSGWAHAAPRNVTSSGAGNMTYVITYVPITDLTGNYYIGYEVLTNSHPCGVNVTHVYLRGRTYE